MGTKIWASVHFDEAPPDAIPIEIMAKQFAWNFRYPGPDGKFGHTELTLINDAAGINRRSNPRTRSAKHAIDSSDMAGARPGPVKGQGGGRFQDCIISKIHVINGHSRPYGSQ